MANRARAENRSTTADNRITAEDRRSERHTVRGVSGVNVLAGIWLVLAPFVIGYSDVGAAVTNGIAVGIVVLVLAAWGAMAARKVPPVR